MPKRIKIGRCLSCSRIEEMQEHHITPKEVGGITKQIAMLCEECHEAAHKDFTNRELDALGIDFFIHENKLTSECIKIILNK
jgi:5-methylcytosine-specific restriction endonuclease McrA